MRLLTVLLAAASLTACASTSSTPVSASGYTAIEIAEGACFGTCPIYSIRITPDDHFVLNGLRFTRHDGLSEGTLAEGAFQRMAGILETRDADALPASITPDNRAACGSTIMSDMASVVLTMEAGDEHQTVIWYPGCALSPYNDTMDAITERMRVEYDYTSRIAPKR
tara:strand:+ start:12191 stop:12691 length:501 start_codon:yes stop_codon:yes gene_type:complete